ncbi:MAG: hypothetical protein K2X38_02155 [Gemmataceae bacterium]|nr:hypothetical protein [Gemmataceae bacterium]
MQRRAHSPPWKRAAKNPAHFISRHVAGDWDEVCAGDKRLNDEAVKEGTRIISAYRTAMGEKLWVITEADRSVTTILLPDEY